VAFEEITPERAHASLQHFRIIDVREPHELRGPLGLIEGAEPFPLATVAARADDLAASGPLLLVCRSGKRSGVACETLQELGIPDVTNLSGGMIAWHRAGLLATLHEPKTLCALRDTIIAWLAQVSSLTEEGAGDLLRDRFARQGVAYDEPSHASLDELIDYVGTCLETINPPDLDLSLATDGDPVQNQELPVTVNVGESGSIMVGSGRHLEPVEPAGTGLLNGALRKRLQFAVAGAAPDELPVILDISGEASQQRVIAVLDTLAGLGIRQVNLIDR